MFSKLSISLAAALALSAAQAVCPRKPNPDQHRRSRALAGQVTDQLHIDATDPANGAVTTRTGSRAGGRSLPASSGAWVERNDRKDTDEGAPRSWQTSQSQ